MMILKKFHVTHVDTGGWELKEVGGEYNVWTLLKRDLLKELHVYVPEGSVVIHKKDGKIQEERTYPRKRDPRKSKG